MLTISLLVLLTLFTLLRTMASNEIESDMNNKIKINSELNLLGGYFLLHFVVCSSVCDILVNSKGSRLTHFPAIESKASQLQLNRIYFVSAAHSHFSSCSSDIFRLHRHQARRMQFLIQHMPPAYLYLLICVFTFICHIWIFYLDKNEQKEVEKIPRGFAYSWINLLVCAFGSEKKWKMSTELCGRKASQALLLLLLSTQQNLPFAGCNAIWWISSPRVHAFRFIHSKEITPTKKQKALPKLSI